MKFIPTALALLAAATAGAQTYPPAVLLKDMRPGSGDGISQFKPNAAVAGTRMVYVALDTTTGSFANALWSSDGTAAGTQMISKTIPVTLSLEVQPVISYNGRVYFNGNTPGIPGYRLFSTAGAPGDVAELKAGTASFENAGNFAVYNGSLYFAGSIGTVTGLYRTDGTAANTVRIAPSVNPRRDSRMVVHNGKLVFAGQDATLGSYIYATDGTTAGTSATTPYLQSVPEALTPLDATRLVFVSGNSNSGLGTGKELWITNGTVSGTALLKDIKPGSVGSDALDLVQVGTKVFFSAEDSASNRELWVTDGTAAGTVKVKETNPAPDKGTVQGVCRVGTKVLFAASRPTNANTAVLWSSDGTAAGTTVLKDILLSAALDSTDVIGGRLCFIASNTSILGRPWVSDGTAAGTHPLCDSATAPTAVSSERSFLGFGSRIYFMGNTAATGREVWSVADTATVPPPQGVAALPEASGIRIFPNPANTELHLIAPGEGGSVSFSDLSGRVLHRQDFNAGAHLTVPVAAWPAGIYLATIRTPKGVSTVRWMIVR